MKTPIGSLLLEGDLNGVSAVKFSSEVPSIDKDVPSCLNEAVNQLTEYFENKLTHFDLVLNPSGTEFQKKVWNTLLGISFGKTKTYLDIAKVLGDPKVIRAAASANGKNPISIIIPCHRVIGSDGSLTGYAGGLQRKKWLLEHESPVKQGELF